MTADRIAYLMELRSELLALDRLERKMRTGSESDTSEGQLSIASIAVALPAPAPADPAMPLDPPGRS